MSKISIVLSTILSAVMLLTACGQETNTNVPKTNVPTLTAEATATSEVVSGTETAVPTNGTGTPAIPVTGEENPARLSKQLDFTVWNKNGEQIGEVDDMVLDLDNTTISYVIVGTGGFLGLGEKHVLVPRNSLQLQTGTGDKTGGHQNAFIFQGDQEVYKNAPDVDVDSILPEKGQPAGDWDKAIHNYWETGVLPSTQTPNPDMTATASPDQTSTPEGTPATAMKLQGVMLASDALDASVRLRGQDDGQDDQKAEVKEMIVDVNSGKVQYLVIDTKFDDGEHWIPVAIKALQWDAENEAFLINVDAATLQGAPFFKEDQYPDTTADGWDNEFRTFWQNIETGVQATPQP